MMRECSTSGSQNWHWLNRFSYHRCRIQELGVALTHFSTALAELRDEVVAAQGTDSGV
jgi:hypothetical protein